MSNTFLDRSSSMLHIPPHPPPPHPPINTHPLYLQNTSLQAVVEHQLKLISGLNKLIHNLRETTLKQEQAFKKQEEAIKDIKAKQRSQEKQKQEQEKQKQTEEEQEQAAYEGLFNTANSVLYHALYAVPEDIV